MLLAGLLAFNLSAKAQSYCTAAYTYGCAFGDNIDDFVLNGFSSSSINHTSTGCSPSSYGTFTSMYAHLAPGMTYTGTLTTTSTFPMAFHIWIDYNSDGVFSSAESVAFGDMLSGTSSGSGSFSITIPTGATPGNYRMRVRAVRAATAATIDPCAPYDYGETHDYKIVVPTFVSCTGAYSPGTMVTDMPGDSVLPGVPFTLSVVDGPIGTGLTYQWGASWDGGLSFTPLFGATGETLTVPGATEICYIRLTFCSSTSSINVIYCIGYLADFVLCGYTPYGLGGGLGLKIITKTSITGTSLHVSSSSEMLAGSGIYKAWPNADSFTTTVYKTVPFELKVSTGNDGSAAQIGAWIDYNHNGAFDSTEFTLVAASSPSNTVANPSALFSTKSIIIPATALTGLTKMRIRTRAASATPFTGAMAQSSLPDGETEDYFITILEAGPCDTPVVALGLDSVLCPGAALTLDAGNPGMTHNWSTGETTQTIPVATAGTYAVTVSDGACSATDSIVILTATPPVAGEIFVSGEAPTYYFNTYLTTDATTMVWHFGDGATATTELSSHTYTANGTYEVFFIATNACGMSDTSVGSVTVEGLGINSIQNGNHELSVYPNPTDGKTVVDSKGVTIRNLQIIDASGKIVWSKSGNGSRQTIDVSRLPSGIYTLQVQTERGSKTLKLGIR